MSTKKEKKRSPSTGAATKALVKRVKVKAGQVIGVSLCDGSYALAHIARYELSIWCVLFDRRASKPEDLLDGLAKVLTSRPIAVMEVTPNRVQDGSWPVIAMREPTYPPEMIDTHGNSSVGTITQMLFEAYYGLRPWDDGFDPRDYEKRLLPGVPVPPTIRYKRDFEKDAVGASASASASPPAVSDAAEPHITDGPAEIHIAIKYPGEEFPSIDLLHQRQALERALEEAGAGEVTDAGGGGGVMDIYLATVDIRHAMPLVQAAVDASSLAKDATIETLSADPDDGED